MAPKPPGFIWTVRPPYLAPHHAEYTHTKVLPAKFPHLSPHVLRDSRVQMWAADCSAFQPGFYFRVMARPGQVSLDISDDGV